MGTRKKKTYFFCVINCGPEREIYRDMRYNSHRRNYVYKKTKTQKIACTLTMISDQNCLITHTKHKIKIQKTQQYKDVSNQYIFSVCFKRIIILILLRKSLSRHSVDIIGSITFSTSEKCLF